MTAPSETLKDPAAGADARADTVPPKAAAKTRKGPPKVLVALVVLGGIAGGVAYWLHNRHYEETDDAQVDGSIASISSRVVGTVTGVAVTDNQLVNAGDLLAELDPIDFEVAVAQARAGLAQAEAALKVEDPSIPMMESSNESALASAAADLASAQSGLAGALREVKQFSAQLTQSEANARTAQLDKDRSAALVKTGAVSQAEFDTRSNGAEAATANALAIREALGAAGARVAQQQARITAAQARLVELRANSPRQVETKKAVVVARQASVELAKAQLKQAELNLSYTKIVAPVSGIVGKKSLSLGDHVAPGQLLLAISQVQDLYVTANFRETQLARMLPGQIAEVSVDSLGIVLRGKVESFAGATGSRFSLFPPENASGNYVKVVQRIPVRIRLDPGQSGLERLRQGMSVEPSVKVR